MKRLEKFKKDILSQEEMLKVNGSRGGGESTGFRTVHEYTCVENCQDIQHEVYIDGKSVGTTPIKSYDLDCIFS